MIGLVIGLVIVAVYVVVAVWLFATKRDRWCDLEAHLFPAAYARGEIDVFDFVALCVFWPIGWPIFRASERKHFEGHLTWLTRFVLRGHNAGGDQ